MHKEGMEIEEKFSAYKVLVVDDVPANVLLLKVMLEQEGFLVEMASGGSEAIDCLRKEKIDLILLDVLMPGISGFELAKQLRNQEEWKNIPIIFLTALDTPADVVTGFQSGGYDFISKPFNKEELLVRVKHQLSMAAAKKTIIRQTEELRHTVEGRDRLYSVIAHDLRAPMSSLKMILNALTLLVEKERVSPDCVEMLQNANDISEELFSLLDNLLKWSRSQLGRMQAIPQVINLPELTQGLIDVYASVAMVKQVSISLESPSQAEVMVDIDMIKTVIRNLLSNAVKYSYPGGAIRVTIETSGDEVVLNVRDQGCGISKENQTKLLDSSTHYTSYGTASEEGSGLGLLLVLEFLKYNSGRLYFESEEGKGACFGFSLPRLK